MRPKSRLRSSLLFSPAFLAAVAFALLGAACISLRVRAWSRAPHLRGDTFWRLTYELTFRATAPGSRVRVALPGDTSQSRVLRETSSHTGLLTDVLRNKDTQGREVVAVASQAAPDLRLTLTFDIHARRHAQWPTLAPKSTLTTAARARYLRSEPGVQVHPSSLSAFAAPAGKFPKAQTVEQIHDYCSEKIIEGEEFDPSDAATALREGLASPLGKARAMVALCRSRRVPARLVAGFILRDDWDAAPHTWVEAYVGKQWVPYDPVHGYAGELPANYVPVQRNGCRIVGTSGVPDCKVWFSIQRRPPPPTFLAAQPRRLWHVADLTRLPPGMQETLTVLLLLPLGAVITAFFRNVIGIQTFGTFTPTLIAMSFVYASWQTGVVVLLVVMGIGLAGRFLLDRLKLLAVPRLGIVLTLVVLCLTMAVSLLDYYGLTPSARAVLLPVVILTMLIERFHITAEEDGPRYALKTLAGTIGVAFCCLLLLLSKNLGRLVLSLPEAQCFVIAALILLGRYAGYRFTELLRFRDFAGDAHPG